MISSASLLKTSLLIAAMGLLGGCVVSPRVELSQSIRFDQPVPDQKPMNYSDLLCCEQCSA